MFTKLPRLASRAAPLLARNIDHSIISQRLFSAGNDIPFPHTNKYLELQQKLFKFQNIPAEVTTLPKGTELVGMNVSISEPHFLSTRPVYHPEILKAITHNEKLGWFELAKSYYAQLGTYNLLCDIDCVTTKSEAGVPIHFIDNRFLDANSYTPLERIFDSEPTSLKP